jgi:thiol-disulfide isomerase/thioredoxin
MTGLHRRQFAVAALAAPLFPSAQTAPDESRAPALPALGTPLALPALERLDGTRFSPRDADGRTLVVYWWASWCPFCAETTPHVEALWREQRSRGLAMLALSIDKDPKAARDHLARRGYTLPAAWVTPDVQRALPKPRGLPIMLVRGRDGRVVHAEAGQMFPEDVVALARFVG